MDKYIQDMIKDLENSFIMEIDEEGIIRIREFNTNEERVNYIYGRK